MKLSDPFPKTAVHWRREFGQNSMRNNMVKVLAYLDARDVMERFDQVHPNSWQCIHYDCGGKMACKIGIDTSLSIDGAVIQGGWVWRSDGAGETNIEAEKGAFSGAFKRAAVMWGVGRYLYDLKDVWVPCDPQGNFKQSDCWKFAEKQDDLQSLAWQANEDIQACSDLDSLICYIESEEYKSTLAKLTRFKKPWAEKLLENVEKRKNELLTSNLSNQR